MPLKNWSRRRFAVPEPPCHPRGHPSLHKVVSLICTPTTTYPFVISKRTGMTVNQVANEVLYTGLIEMQELDAPG